MLTDAVTSSEWQHAHTRPSSPLQPKTLLQKSTRLACPVLACNSRQCRHCTAHTVSCHVRHTNMNGYYTILYLLVACAEPTGIKLESIVSLDSIAAGGPVQSACPSSWAVRIGCTPALSRSCMSRSRSGRWPATRRCRSWHSVAVSLCRVSPGSPWTFVRDKAQSRLMQAFAATSLTSCHSLGLGVGHVSG